MDTHSSEPVHLIEYETMLMGRYSHLAPAPCGLESLERGPHLLLSRLHAEGPMTIRQLSETFRLDPSTLNRQTSALMRDGLVERIPDPQGGIARKFRITDKGEACLEERRERTINSLREILADWSPQDAAAFAAYLHRFNTDVERRSGRPWPRPTHAR